VSNKDIGLEKTGPAIFQMLGLIRIYTPKKDNAKFPQGNASPSKKALLFQIWQSRFTRLPQTVSSRKGMSKRLRFNPQRVGGAFALKDKGTVEIRMKLALVRGKDIARMSNNVMPSPLVVFLV